MCGPEGTDGVARSGDARSGDARPFTTEAICESRCERIQSSPVSMHGYCIWKAGNIKSPGQKKTACNDFKVKVTGQTPNKNTHAGMNVMSTEMYNLIIAKETGAIQNITKRHAYVDMEKYDRW